MFRFHRIALAIASAVIIAISKGHAADLPAIPPVGAIPPADAVPAAAVLPGLPIFLAVPWTGFYLGAHVGYGWGTKTFLDNFPTPDLALDAAPGISGIVGGMQGGYNYQINWLVIGVDGVFSWSGAQNSSFSCFSFGNQDCSAQPEWLAAATGRIGVALGPALIYAKGGAAWVEDHYTNIATCSGSQPRSRAGITAACGDLFTADNYRVGWTAGLGIEYQFAQNWFLRAEYDYMDFGGQSVSFSDGGTGFFTEEIHQKMNMVTVGVNYRFGGPTPTTATALNTNMLADTASDAATLVDEPTSHVLPFTAFSVAKFSFDALAGALIAPSTDLDTSGLRVFIQGGGGFYQYFGNASSAFKGVYETGDILAGYGFEGDYYSINLLVGPSVENDTLNMFDPDNRVVGTQFGAKVRGDAWVNFTPNTLVYSEGEFSSAFLTYYTKAKFGYDFFNSSNVFIGPEIGALGNERFNQLRVGAGVTQIKIRNFQLDLSAGYANDSVVGPGAYGTLELSTTF
jgi:outer membrane immunogenic protein